eukprot:scaffold94655_cov17-Prasinocladus_malaysianus.AAC.1
MVIRHAGTVAALRPQFGFIEYATSPINAQASFTSPRPKFSQCWLLVSLKDFCPGVLGGLVKLTSGTPWLLLLPYLFLAIKVSLEIKPASPKVSLVPLMLIAFYDNEVFGSWTKEPTRHGHSSTALSARNETSIRLLYFS